VNLFPLRHFGHRQSYEQFRNRKRTHGDRRSPAERTAMLARAATEAGATLRRIAPTTACHKCRTGGC
jgi:hypothetical protein